MTLRNAFEDLSTESTLDAIRTLLEDGMYAELFTDGTLIASEANVVSEWFDFQELKADTLRISHTRTAGTYIFEIDWSRDGITSDVTEVVQGSGANNTSMSKMVAMRYGKFRIRNSSTTQAFSTHRTVVIGRPR